MDASTCLSPKAEREGPTQLPSGHPQLQTFWASNIFLLHVIQFKWHKQVCAYIQQKLFFFFFLCFLVRLSSFWKAFAGTSAMVTLVCRSNRSSSYSAPVFGPVSNPLRCSVSNLQIQQIHRFSGPCLCGSISINENIIENIIYISNWA